VLCLAVVLLVQALLMADGGITALGTNVTLIALVTVTVGWATFVVLRRVLPSRDASVPVAATLAAFISVPSAALVFTGLFAVGGQAPVDLSLVLAAMLGWHTLIDWGRLPSRASSLPVSCRRDLISCTAHARSSPYAPSRSARARPGWPHEPPRVLRGRDTGDAAPGRVCQLLRQRAPRRSRIRRRPNRLR
jgi:cobalt/nickel transport system permease protein